MLHKAGRDAKGKPQVRIGEVPATQLLDASDSVGDGVAMHAEPGSRLAEAGCFDDGAERRHAFVLNARPADKDWIEELSSLAGAVGKVVEIAQQVVGR